MTFEETAHAKLNLALHVRRRRPDGYHDLETIFAFTELGDALTAELSPSAAGHDTAPAGQLDEQEGCRPVYRGVAQQHPSAPISLAIDGVFATAIAPNGDNLVLRAADALRAASGTQQGAAIRLVKHLPVAAGIGGGSADAAATLRLLNRLWRLDWPVERLAQLGSRLGADVAACVHSCTLRGQGRGEVLQPIAGAPLTGVPVLVVNPRIAVPTAAVFARWGGVDHGPLAQGDPIAVAAAGRNDLEPPARALAPVIDTVLTALAAQRHAHLVRMSGSGATCFALFDTPHACQAAETAIRRTYPGWWVAATQLL